MQNASKKVVVSLTNGVVLGPRNGNDDDEEEEGTSNKTQSGNREASETFSAVPSGNPKLTGPVKE